MSEKNNRLEIGKIRTGSLIDGDSRTPEIQVPLELTDESIAISLSWTEFQDSPYARWFAFNTLYVDDPDQAKYAYKVPEQLWFSDSYGDIAILGCRAANSRSNFRGANAKVFAQAAVLNARPQIDYSVVNGLRSSITGLRRWVGQTSLTDSVERNDQGLISSAKFTLKSPEPIILDNSGATVLRFHWTTENRDDVKELHDLLYVETRSSDLAQWHELETTHRAIRDLLALASWRPHAMEVTSVIRIDDPVRTQDGTARGEKWCPVISVPSEKTPDRHARTRYLVEFSDLEISGFSSWLTLREHFARAIDPTVSLLDMKGVGKEVLVAQLGIGLESLGYLLFIEDGTGNKTAGEKTFQQRLTRIAGEFGTDWPFDLDNWAATMAKAYNGVKHINRTPVDTLLAMNAWRESVIVMRSWIALRLGVSPATLRSRLQHDPMSHSYVLA